MAWGADPPPLALDLGSGGGVPGLPLALAWPLTEWVLVDAGERRAEFLGQAVAELGLGERVGVVRRRAEELGRDPAQRGRYPLVTARSFGSPAVTAECAAPLLAIGGRLIVSEPPLATGHRWPAAALAGLGLEPERLIRLQAGYQVLRQVAPCPERFPRRSGVPAKRPLF